MPNVLLPLIGRSWKRLLPEEGRRPLPKVNFMSSSEFRSHHATYAQCPCTGTPLPPIGGAEKGEQRTSGLRVRSPGSRQRASALTLCDQKRITWGRDFSGFTVEWGSPRAKLASQVFHKGEGGPWNDTSRNCVTNKAARASEFSLHPG